MLKDYLYITGLALRDISHERVLSLCMACSLGAIFTPIIILLGLHQGIIGNMLDTLDKDPSSRLVRPKFMSQSPLPREELTTIAKAGVELIPSETSHLLVDVRGLPDSVNVVPSSKSDPFVVESDPIPLSTDNKWVVISESLSKKLGKHKLDTLTLLLRRTTQANQPEEVPMDFNIAGVLNAKLMPDLKIYIPASTFDGIYYWRKGYAVPELDLKGNRENSFSPEYDGVIATFQEKKPKKEDFRQMIAGRFPFSTMPIVYDKYFNASSNLASLLWKTVNSSITLEDIEVLNNALLNFGYKTELTPYIDSIDLQLNHKSLVKTWKITTLTKSLSPTWHDNVQPVLVVPSEDVDFIGDQELIIKTGIQKIPVTIPVSLITSDHVPSGYIIASQRFSGLLRTASRVGAVYDKERFAFSLNSKEQVRYFRVYSPSIGQLEEVVNAVKSVGEKLDINALKNPVSRLYEVQRISTLSDYMKRIYLLIATISGVSTIFAVSASVYATVQRRKRDLAYLNMLGVHKDTIVFFPFIKSMILILVGLFISFGAYWLFGVLASHWFVDLLGETESLTRLKASYALSLIAITLFLGGISSLLAGRLVSKIDSKRYIHE